MIAGYCWDCIAENVVNMANIIFTGSVANNFNLYLGGIVGYLYTSGNGATVKNCANYGSVTHSGIAYYTNIGGVVGSSYGSSKRYIQNSLNYGTITHSGTTSYSLYIGGILGYSSGTHNIENCVSSGKISLV